jgi:hypothetical protein
MFNQALMLLFSVGLWLYAGGFQATKEVAMTTESEAHGVGHARKHAEAKVEVQNSEAKPYDQLKGSILTELILNETFTGEIEGQSMVRALEVQCHDKSAHMVSMQRVNGKIDGREGTFVLQGIENVEKGRIKATWFVVPGSGTGNLSGLRGEGGFEGVFGKASNGWLDYWFE